MKNSFGLKTCATAAGVAMLCGQAAAALNFVRLGVLTQGGHSGETRLSSDGTAASGSIGIPFDSEPGPGYRWDSVTGIRRISTPADTWSSQSYGISGDGRVVVGGLRTFNGSAAYRWTQAGGLVSLGDLRSGNAGLAYAASWDGSVVVGRGTGPSSQQAFKWTEGTGMTALAMLSGYSYSSAFAVSDDGKTIVGLSGGEGVDGEPRIEATMWTASGILGLGNLLGGTIWSEAKAVNGGGTAVAGWSYSFNGTEAFRWTMDGGMVGLGDLPGSGFSSRGLGISGDGGIVVGYGTTESGKEAFVWDEAHGMRTLRSLLEAQGMDVTGWIFSEASGISADGNVIAGTAWTPQGNWESFVVSGLAIPEPSAAGLTGLALGATAMRRRRERA